ncbi:efflux RND transporter periplasmic adaptor subunit [Rhizosaccharibacter radicis]|uniref:Efflux RND transporter periplasmic adaptor subunit n=1 Tax=Rhizosaccharibacter radicis TaxID=2782605 RepID=A0ABT1W2V5_9PROT|nr:efflux RND transporter periplasmic adaptor subunit [Acetobacteraceae bacterium KSS12]
MPRGDRAAPPASGGRGPRPGGAAPRGARCRPAAIILAGVAACSLAACKQRQDPGPDPRLADRVVAVERVAAGGTIGHDYTGVVQARVESDLGFRVPGKVTERLVDTGQVVTRGQPLMRIDPTDYEHALIAQNGNVAAARARWIQTAADERRDRGLVASGAISRSTYDQVKAAADAARAILDAAEAQQRVARNQEDYALLLADSDGTVMQTLVEPGQVVAAGQTVLRLAHAGPREAVIDLPETIRPAPGSTAEAMLYGGRLRVMARLRQLSDSADPRTRTFEARFVMTGPGAAAPLGATVTVALPGGPGEAPTSVPLDAVDDEGHGPGVWVVDERTSRVAYRPVQVLGFGEETAEIGHGLHRGDLIVATGGHELHDGERVRPTRVGATMQ